MQGRKSREQQGILRDHAIAHPAIGNDRECPAGSRDRDGIWNARTRLYSHQQKQWTGITVSSKGVPDCEQKLVRHRGKELVLESLTAELVTEDAQRE